MNVCYSSEEKETSTKMSDEEEGGMCSTGSTGISVGVGVSVGVEAATGTDDVLPSSEPTTPVPAVNACTTTPTTACAGTGTNEDNIIQQDEDPNKPQWPSMVDLNTRLRKVINSYQRNFKKEETKLLQKAKVSIYSVNLL